MRDQLVPQRSGRFPVSTMSLTRGNAGSRAGLVSGQVLYIHETMSQKVRAPVVSQGFSLIELLVALVILSILTGLAAPSLAGVFRESRARGVAAQVAADIASARMLAVRSGRGASLDFTGPTSYQIREGRGAGAVTRKSVNLATDYGSAVELIRVSTGEAVVFDSRGMATSGAGKLAVHSTGAGHAVRSDTIRISPLGLVRRDR
jgi:prepilin-type N-terminal cleavage/methylation domain-containing protein